MKREIDVTIMDSKGKEFTFSTFGQIKNFYEEELKFWVDANAKLPGSVTANQQYTKLDHLQTIVNTFDSWKEAEPTWDELDFAARFDNLYREQIHFLSDDWIWHGHPFVPIWLELYKKHPHSAQSFICSILNKPPTTISNSVESMTGHILAYEYLLQDESELTNRRKSEKRSLSQLRDQLREKNDELIADVESFQDDFSTWNESTRNSGERLYKVRQKLGERQIRNQERVFSRELAGWQDKISNLEETYAELLKLKKPAEYWNTSAKKYWHQGLGFFALIVVLAVGGLVYFEGFFSAWLSGQELNVSLNTLQGVVIFGTIVTIYAFLVRVLSRMAFSSFHLMRDAEEREQLTYLYLSLSEETSVEEESRNIILQALFSRTETGLLSQEHGPAMPGVGEAIRYATKSKS